MIEENESKRCNLINQVFQKAQRAISSLRETNDPEAFQKTNEILKVLNEVGKLNVAFNERAKELINRSNFYDYINQIVDEDEDQDTLMFIDSYLVDSEMKRRAIEDIKFNEAIKEFDDSGVIFMLNRMSNSYFQKDKKYAFCNDLINLLNSNLFKIRGKKLLNFESDLDNMRNDLYWTIKIKYNEPPKKV
ncbi:hypothetical protein M9Y10_040329 [Tritrichomonas musculus]|uniref:Uncharacterized protein n=1 Tax=Tritrichomonas musculus TaxID=1915356 RepID=A0ABR2GPY6_9EUKA